MPLRKHFLLPLRAKTRLERFLTLGRLLVVIVERVTGRDRERPEGDA